MSGDLDGLAGLSLIVVFGVFDGDYFDMFGFHLFNVGEKKYDTSSRERSKIKFPNLIFFLFTNSCFIHFQIPHLVLSGFFFFFFFQK